MVRCDDLVPDVVEREGGGGGVEGSQQEPTRVRCAKDGGRYNGSVSDRGGEREKEEVSHRGKKSCEDLNAAADNRDQKHRSWSGGRLCY